MEIETVSIEVIKPSQPTPSNHRSHQFSIFDQFIPHAHLSVPFFYSPPLLSHQPDLIIALIKSSLSKALTLFYPLAGRLKSDDSHIDCNDEGVKFVHARVRHCSLSQALSPPRPHQMMRQLFPIEHTIGGELLGVQVSFFECGGIAIGVYLSHKVADPRSLCTFVLSWASIAKSGSSVLKPIFDLASVFPPINELPPCPGDEPDIAVPDRRVIVDKVFRFEASKIAALKAKAKAKVDEEDPTKMMAVAAFLWTIFAAMDGDGKKGNNSSSPRYCMISVPVYVRGKVASLEEHTMGNAAATPLTKPMAPPIDLSAMPELVEAMRDVVRRVDEGGLVKRRDGGELVKMMEAYIEASNKAYDSEGELGLYEASSWDFPFYDADFGWGRPGWVGVVNGAFANVVVCLDTKSGDGIDATVTLSEQDMAEFESMAELLKYATPVHNALD
ncbi:hypothetical protein Scep_021071 [Stephania cephalantha]|uniref:BAHD acyltransferase n=1 Tax=Stephania cephalantha TaxID=152367 RepID=A0AAP0F5F9_9MAGN